MNEVQIIQQKIYEIRGQRVILDFDLAELYQVTTGNLNKAVKRNIRRFPTDFMFQLSKEEFDELKKNLIFQFGISRWGGTRKLPHAFTEQGVAMLSGILNSRNVSRSPELITSVRIRSTVLKWKAFATS
ncbi:MAG: ORF6N domain-containing protein [Bacteroidaceae bacterium]|nr:ORF6N domain-containing protein [Bacteroidaceae bacterium]